MSIHPKPLTCAIPEPISPRRQRILETVCTAANVLWLPFAAIVLATWWFLRRCADIGQAIFALVAGFAAVCTLAICLRELEDEELDELAQRAHDGADVAAEDNTEV